MTEIETPLPASRTYGSIVPVWVLAAVGAVLVGVFVPDADHRYGGLCLSLAVCALAAFAVQLSVRRREGFVTRVTLSIVGALVVTAIASIVLALVGAV